MNTYNSAKYWDKEWQKRPEVFYPFFPRIKSLIKEGSKVLDVASGVGTLKRYLGGDVTCLDLSKEAIKRCGGGIIADFAEFDSRKRFDCVISTEYLEHAEDDELALRKMRKLAPVVICSVPNNRLGPEEEKEHNRKYTKESLRKLFEKYFKRVDIWDYETHLLVRGGQDYPTKRILIAVLNEGYVRAELANYLITLSHDNRYELKIYYPNARPIENNRNQIIKKFLAEGYDFLYMMDDDTYCYNNALDLIELDKDVMGLPCRTFNENQFYWNVMREVKDGWQGYLSLPDDKLHEVDAVGTGQIIIKREVLKNMNHPFEITHHKDGTMNYGLDFYFCKKIKIKGFKVWSHFGYICGHFGGEIDFSKGASG